MKPKKIDILLDFMSKGDKINSIKLVATFNRGVTPEEKEIIEIASECYKGNENFYKKLGYNVEEYKVKAWDAIVKNYGKQLDNWLKNK